MTFNLDWIEKYYQSLPGKMAELRQLVNRPLTYTEKILYAHLSGDLVEFRRGVDYVEFNPDRVAMQDATAQMALLQLPPFLAPQHLPYVNPYQSSFRQGRHNFPTQPDELFRHRASKIQFHIY